MATEEKTELKNHLKWARIQVANDGRFVPREVSIVQNGIRYFIPIWVESTVRMEMTSEIHNRTIEEDDTGTGSGQPYTQRIKLGTQGVQVQKFLLLRDLAVVEHVEGTEKPTIKVGTGRAREKHEVGLNEKKGGEWATQALGEKADLRANGSDYAAQVIFNNTQVETEKAQVFED